MKHVKKIFPPVFLILFSIIFYNCSGVSPNYGKYSSALKTQLNEMYLTLNGGHAAEFMSKYADPSYIASTGGVDNALLQFSNRRQTALMNALKVARETEPLYDESRNIMTYSSSLLPQPVIMKMVNGKWYLTSDWFK